MIDKINVYPIENGKFQFRNIEVEISRHGETVNIRQGDNSIVTNMSFFTTLQKVRGKAVDAEGEWTDDKSKMIWNSLPIAILYPMEGDE